MSDLFDVWNHCRGHSTGQHAAQAPWVPILLIPLCYVIACVRQGGRAFSL